MKAVRYHDYGGPEALQIDDVERPAPGPGEVLVEVAFSSVNPIDWKMASGEYKMVMPVKRPAIPGYDLSGVIVEVGEGCERLKVGDRVAAHLVEKIGVPGATHAELTVAPEAQCAVVPEGVDLAEAAALPLAGCTALQALRDDCGMAMSGETRRVLIPGASGGVGHLAVQHAHNAGAHVTAVCSGARAEVVRELGADEVIDYRETSDMLRGEPYDLAVDCAGKAPWSSFKGALAKGGVLAQPTPNASWLFAKIVANTFSSRKIRLTGLKPSRSDLELLLQMMSEGRLRCLIGESFPLEELSDAWSRNQKGGVLGKISISHK